jgi:3-deoxy-D-manno-octulosonic-acid transferase
VIVAGSTHEGDEVPLVQAFKGIQKTFPEALLVLVPRHPERFQSAAALARSAGLRMALRSESTEVPAGIDCLVVDAMGELLSCYAACDIAFVGGSLAPVGGHNLLEPAALSAPVLMGPHTQHSADITAQLVDAGAALVVQDVEELGQAFSRLLGHAGLRDDMGAAGQRVFSRGQGAVDRTLRLVSELLER